MLCGGASTAMMMRELLMLLLLLVSECEFVAVFRVFRFLAMQMNESQSVKRKRERNIENNEACK